MTKSTRQSGFTLLETILSLALTALIVGMLATMARQWIANWDRGKDKMAQIENVLLAEDRIARDLNSALTFISPRQNPKLTFIGSAHDIIIVREALKSEGTAGLIAVHYRSEAATGITRQTALYDPMRPLNALSFGDPITLLRQPYQFSFDYRGPDGTSKPAWQDPEFPDNLLLSLTSDDGQPFSQNVIDLRAPIPAPCARVETLKDCKSILQKGVWPQIKSSIEKGKKTNPLQNNTQNYKL